MAIIRFGVIGLGAIGSGHARRIAAAGQRAFTLTAVADPAGGAATRIGSQLGVAAFASAGELFKSALCDAVMIAAPHYLHPELTIQAARAGLHVLCEKPLAPAIGPARAMVSACRRHKVALGVMLQHRTRDVMKKMHRLAAGGTVGEIYHVELLCSDWYRTQAYYDSAAWRGTWDGEGGGVLINQAPHALDLLTWIVGMPRRVAAIAGTRYHRIEVENTAAAVLDYGRGRTGYIYASTAHAGGSEELRVWGDRAVMIARGDTLRLGRLRTPLSRHVRQCSTFYADADPIPIRWREVKVSPSSRHDFMTVIRAFAAHLLRGTPLVATGAEALNELELSNAIYLAAHEGRTVDLPVDAVRMDRLLARLARGKKAGGGLYARCNRNLKRLLKEEGLA